MNKRIVQGLALPVGLLVLWQAVVFAQVVSEYLLPGPLTVCNTVGELWQSGVLAKNIMVSLWRVAQGFALSCALAIPLGVLCGASKRVQAYSWLTLEFWRHVPPLAAIPLIILWAGIGEASKLTIIMLAAFFPLFLNTYSGVKNCDEQLVEVGQTLGFTPREIVWQVRVPAALEAIAVGMQLALGYSWRALIGAELIAASSGIGYMILDAEEMSRPDVVLVGMIAIGIIGTVLDTVFLALLRKWLPWHEL